MKTFYESGFILVMVMFFLLVLSLLAFRLLEVGLLESRMVNSYQNRIKSFYIAESYLSQAEQNLLRGVGVRNAKVEVIASGVCGVTFYRLKVKAEYHGAKSCLESSWAKIDEANSCIVKPDKNSSGRQSFLINDCSR